MITLREYFDNYGTFRQVARTTNSAISSVMFDNYGLLDVEGGLLILANNGTSSNATFMAAAGAAIDITGGLSPTWAGTISGVGAGAVVFQSGTLNSGPTATLNFTNGLFQWQGGQLIGNFTNVNSFTLSGSNKR